MALLDPNPRTQGPRISQILPTVKCSTCSKPVPLDRLGDHICAPASTSSIPPSDTKPSPPPLTVQTSPSPLSPAPSSPMNALFSRRPPTNQRDVRAHDGPRLRNGSSFSSSVPSRGNTPSPAPSRAGVRSPAPVMAPSPSPRAKSPFLPSPSSPTRGPISRPELISDVIVPVNSRPGLSAHDARSSTHRRPSIPSSPLAQPPSLHSFRDPRPAPTPPHPPIRHPVRSAPSPAPSDYSLQRFASPEVDTKSGGVAGMAGVGRRGFAAVARAAMFATSHIHPVHSPMPAPWVPASSPRAAPPMPYPTPASRTVGSPHSPPHDSRFPPDIPLPPRPPSSTVPSKAPSLHRRGGSANSKPSSIPFPVKSPDLSKPSAAPGPLTPTTPSRPSFSSDKSSQKKASVSGDTIKVMAQGNVTSSFLDHTSDDEGSEFGGLAYAQSDDSDDDALLARVMGRTSGQVHHSPTASSTYSDDAIRTEQTSMEHGLDSALAALLRSPTSTDTPLSPSSPTSSLPRASKPPMRSLTAVAQRESSTLGGIIPRRVGTISGAIGGGSSDNSRKDRQSQDSTASGLDRHREKVMTCIRCSKNIEDKRWIRVENGKGVLCDKCWKNMYLPKCRRCNLPIEKQAVSSSDGQLKGKYHRDCFNCHTCHKPFPDKTFYVFDGKPFCDYHYHEANNSLCAAPDCGRPIEGPCAVSHTGERYHIEHLTCEYEDDECGERCEEGLVDYWEVEGRMLCERHMRQVTEQDMMDSDVGMDEIRTNADLRAMKRKTRFIDIAGLR